MLDVREVMGTNTVAEPIGIRESRFFKDRLTKDDDIHNRRQLLVDARTSIVRAVERHGVSAPDRILNGYENLVGYLDELLKAEAANYGK